MTYLVLGIFFRKDKYIWGNFLEKLVLDGSLSLNFLQWNHLIVSFRTNFLDLDDTLYPTNTGIGESLKKNIDGN